MTLWHLSLWHNIAYNCGSATPVYRGACYARWPTATSQFTSHWRQTYFLSPFVLCIHNFFFVSLDSEMGREIVTEYLVTNREKKLRVVNSSLSLVIFLYFVIRKIENKSMIILLSYFNWMPRHFLSGSQVAVATRITDAHFDNEVIWSSWRTNRMQPGSGSIVLGVEFLYIWAGYACAPLTSGGFSLGSLENPSGQWQWQWQWWGLEGPEPTWDALRTSRPRNMKTKSYSSPGAYWWATTKTLDSVLLYYCRVYRLRSVI